MERPTLNYLDDLGSVVFEGAVFALGLPQFVSRALLAERFALIGVPPADVDIDLLGNLMPQIDEALRLCLPGTEAQNAMSRLTAFILDWVELPEGDEIIGGVSALSKAKALQCRIEWR